MEFKEQNSIFLNAILHFFLLNQTKSFLFYLQISLQLSPNIDFIS